MGRPGGDGAWPRVGPDGTGALQDIASCLTAAQHTVSALRDSGQLIAGGWLGWIRTRRAALGELTADACGPGGAILEGPQRRHPVGESALLLFNRIEEPFRAFDAACGELVPTQPAAARDGHEVPASPLDHWVDLPVGLAAQRSAFSLRPSAMRPYERCIA